MAERGPSVAERGGPRRGPSRRGDPGGDPRGGARAVRPARLPRHLDAGDRLGGRGPAGGDLPLVPLEGGDPRPAPGRLHGRADRACARRARRASERPALRLAAAVREHVAFHGIHRRAAFVTDSEIRALADERRAALIAKRDAYQELFNGLIRDGIRDGSLRTSDSHVATYAILLQCTGVALWFDPDGPAEARRGRRAPRRARPRLARGLAGADRRGDRRGLGARGGGAMSRVKPPALPERATIAVVAPASPPQTRSEIEQATAYFESLGHTRRLRAQPPQGARLPRRHRRGARRRPPVGALGARDRHGPRALRRLRDRPPARPDRLGGARRSADRLRVLRHHRAPPGARHGTPAG